MENNQESLCTSTELGSQMSHEKTFAMFSKLPTEICLMIWKEFRDAYAPRVVTVCYNSDSGFYSKTPLHASFHVNHESRAEALRSLEPAFHNHVRRIGDLAHIHPPNHPPIYVNFSQDVIYLQAAQGNDIRSIIQKMSNTDHNMIQHLAINDPTHLEGLVRSLVVMPRLQRLFIVKINAWLAWDKLAEAEAQHVFFKGYGICGRVWQNNPTRHDIIEEMKELEFLHRWKTPDVCYVSSFELLVMPAHWQRCKGTLSSPKGRWAVTNPRERISE